MHIVLFLSLLILSPMIVGVALAQAVGVVTQPEQSWFGGTLLALQPFILELFGLIIVALGGWLVKIVRDRFGIEIEAKHREALQSALNNAVNLAFGALVKRKAGEAKVIVDGTADVSAAVAYVKKSVPDAVKHFELSDARIKELLEPKIVAKATTPGG